MLFKLYINIFFIQLLDFTNLLCFQGCTLVQLLDFQLTVPLSTMSAGITSSIFTVSLLSKIFILKEIKKLQKKNYSRYNVIK